MRGHKRCLPGRWTIQRVPGRITWIHLQGCVSTEPDMDVGVIPDNNGGTGGRRMAWVLAGGGM